MKEEKERRKRKRTKKRMKRMKRRTKRTKRMKRTNKRKRRGGEGGGGGSLSKISSEETLSKLRLKLNQNKAKSTKHAGRPADKSHSDEEQYCCLLACLLACLFVCLLLSFFLPIVSYCRHGLQLSFVKSPSSNGPTAGIDTDALKGGQLWE